jgi:predicted nucleotidyltransferase
MRKDTRSAGENAGMNISKKDSDFLNKFKKRVLHAFPQRIKSISLFGSRAAGVGKKDSDYDVFIMVDRRDRTLVDAIFDIAYDIYIESNLTVDISPVIMSEEFFNARLSQERRIAIEIVEQGIPL